MKENFRIGGLTTVASIWTSSAIGVLVSISFYVAATLDRPDQFRSVISSVAHAGT